MRANQIAYLPPASTPPISHTATKKKMVLDQTMLNATLSEPNTPDKNSHESRGVKNQQTIKYHVILYGFF
jgi:hypothetical protein